MEDKHRILIVDDDITIAYTMAAILDNLYETKTVTKAEEALKAVEDYRPDLILLDVLMPGLSGFEICRKLKKSTDSGKIPVIFVSGSRDPQSESHGFEVGGVDYIHKPISSDILLARIATHLELNLIRENFENEVEKRTAELLEIQRATIYMLGEAGHYNDTDTGSHIWRMAEFAGIIAEEAGMEEEKVKILKLAAPMHDTGKIGIPDTILKKNAPLDPEEWKIMKTHTVIGHNILLKSTSELFLTAADIALYHHEKWDGNGYPVGLKKDQIPFSARVVAIADVFDALTTERPYKKAWTVLDAIKEIEKIEGSHFDPELVEAFQSGIDRIIDAKEKWDENEKITKKRFVFPLS